MLRIRLYNVSCALSAALLVFLCVMYIPSFAYPKAVAVPVSKGGTVSLGYGSGKCGVQLKTTSGRPLWPGHRDLAATQQNAWQQHRDLIHPQLSIDYDEYGFAHGLPGPARTYSLSRSLLVRG
jgi:hypothetical protein